jgi:ADP-ribose pyrophosphatase
VEPESSREVFRGGLIRVAVETWPAGDREVVHHPGAAAIVAVTAQGDVVLVRQMREAVRRPLLEIPAGIADVTGEEPAACAARELTEETGYLATNVRRIGAVYTSPGFADERIELFAADAVPRGDPTEDGIEVVTMPLADAVAAVRQGRIQDAKTAVALLLAGHPGP